MLLVMEVKVFPQAMTSSHSDKKGRQSTIRCFEREMMGHESMLSRLECMPNRFLSQGFIISRQVIVHSYIYIYRHIDSILSRRITLGQIIATKLLSRPTCIS